MQTEKYLYRKLFNSLLFPSALLLVMWVVKFYEIGFDTSLSRYGLWPRAVKGIPGIFTIPFLHGDVNHITNNSIGLITLGTMVFFFYREVAYKVFIWVYLIGGIWLWIGAPPGVPHIGASGIVYGLASFLFFSGFIRRHYQLMALSLLVTFLYGGIIWYIFPIKEGISWQGHLLGGIAGAISAWQFRKQGSQRKRYSWELEDGESTQVDRIGDAWKVGTDLAPPPQPPENKPDTSIKITYVYKTKPPPENEENQK